MKKLVAPLTGIGRAGLLMLVLIHVMSPLTVANPGGDRELHWVSFLSGFCFLALLIGSHRFPAISFSAGLALLLLLIGAAAWTGSRHLTDSPVFKLVFTVSLTAAALIQRLRDE